MNKGIKRLVSVLLAAAVLAVLCAGALADGEYTYTVRIFSGEIGTFAGGQTVLTYTGLTDADMVPFDPSSVILPADSPYYVRGVRESGRDNNTVSSTRGDPSTNISYLPVQGDADYVVAYGIKGALVAYTVNFVDEAGTELAPSQTYYGNAGDKPVVAYLYIDGYEPQAYNLAKTLLDDEGQNVIDFVYTPVVVPTPIPAAPAPTPYVYTEGAAGGGAAGGAAAGGATAGGGLPAGGGAVEQPGAGGEEAVEGGTVPEAGTPGEDETAPVQEPAAENAPAEEQTAPAAEAAPTQEPETAQIDQDESPQANAPQEYIDLDQTPSGEKPEIKEKPPTELQQERTQSEQKLYIAAGLLGVSLIAIVALVVALVRRRKA